MTAISALSQSIWLLVVTRIFLGVFESACNPPAYGLIADYFHPNYRTSANSIYSLGIYIGGALSSLTAVIITGLGWRWTFALIGFFGIGAGVLGIFLILEPSRGTFDVINTT